MAPTPPRVLIYALRRDLRLSDNPIFHEISRLHAQSTAAFTHLLPIYIFPAEQVEVSGFLSNPDVKSPYPEARSRIGKFWRCGPLRSTFVAESVWDLKESLENVGCGLVVRVGRIGDVVREALDWFDSAQADGVPNEGERTSQEQGAASEDRHELPRGEVVGVWMTAEDGAEERREERDVRKITTARGKEFKLWKDEKYYIDDRDLPFSDMKDLPDIYTTFRKSLEPLRECPRPVLPTPTSLPPLPPQTSVPPQHGPFSIPTTLSGIISALHKPLDLSLGLANRPRWPPGTKTAVPFRGGERAAHDRVDHLITTGAMTAYKDTRNGLLGPDYSTKLSAWLALGCITARQVHSSLLAFEDGTSPLGKAAPGYGEGENPGTAAVRFELLWRDYMRLCTRKFGSQLFAVSGFRRDQSASWRYTSVSPGIAGSNSRADVTRTLATLQRFLSGTTGTGLIDASNRELFLTGYTSNRARQNVASFLAKHLGLDWRLGAEWYECLLVDYDVSNNWGNWQYVAGVGNDPRQGRTFNPVKQALDYDGRGEYVKAWVPELRCVDVDSGTDGGERGEEMLMGLFQAWRLPERAKERLGLKGLEWVDRPLVRIPFAVRRIPRDGFSGNFRGRGRGRGSRGADGYRGKSQHGRGRGRWRTGNMDKANGVGGNEMNGGDAEV